jgi:O-acetyl-ADP-ribose deacetylase (regulator of RNase III)
MRHSVNDCCIEIKRADITREPVDAIVNAANSRLQHGGGVAGAIVRRGGASIQHESDRIGCCPVGQAVVTGAGDLPCRYVIHAVGPINGEGEEERKLRSATRASLQRACELGLVTIAFPAISTGVYRYPVEDCARIMLGEVLAFLQQAPGPVQRVVFCLFGEEVHATFAQTLQTLVTRTD